MSYLLDTFGAQLDSLDLPLLRRVPPKKIATVRSMIERRINTVDTSACGRLFDAVASIVGVRDEVNFEAQAAIELEACAYQGVDAAYPFELSRRRDRRAAHDRGHRSRRARRQTHRLDLGCVSQHPRGHRPSRSVFAYAPPIESIASA